MNIKGLKYEFQYLCGKDQINQFIIELPPHKRTIVFNKENIYVKFPFYTIFSIHCYKNTGLSQYVNSAYINRILASKKPINSLDDIIYPIHYPHVAPQTGNICQITQTLLFESKEKYVNEFISQFWSANNNFYMHQNFDIKKYCRHKLIKPRSIKINYGFLMKNGFPLRKILPNKSKQLYPNE